MNKTNEELIQEIIRLGYLRSPQLIEAFRKIDRKDFVLPEFQQESYLNAPLPIGFGQTISQPLTVAFMLELLEPQAGEKILDIGSGSGWTSALLAHIVSSRELKSKIKNQKSKIGGRVIAIEVIPELKDFGEKNVAKYNFLEKRIVEFICADGSQGYAPEAPFDKILCSAAIWGEVPNIWKKELKTEGKIVVPVAGEIQLWTKEEKEKFKIEHFPGFAFVPLVKKDH